MRRIFGNVLKNSTKKPEIRFPSLPSDISYSQLSYMTKRGFLAKKISEYLFNQTQGECFFFNSFSKISFERESSEAQIDYILSLSDQMLMWHEQDEDIPSKIKHNKDFENVEKNAMLKTHDIFRKELFSSSMKEQGKPSSSDPVNNLSKWEIYRDVIYASTQGQFLLASQEELAEYKKGNIFCKGNIKERADIPKCRNEAQEKLENLGYKKSKFMSWILVLSEAITNTIKHAEEGKMTLIEDEENNEVRFLIEDKGAGFSLEELPNNTLLSGYSSKKSMGQGFTLMMKMAKRVILCTSSKGSTIVLIFDASNAKMENKELVP
ncbi:ATP-binding protein [Aquibacillus sediminis]|uniref:ATP-binding protein n=1 Tax=Aquibacillus sediminis TaxID=2574734 RepID=UPI0014863E7A|nr:ATP-binding protein [Aquibacillus sediminis]